LYHNSISRGNANKPFSFAGKSTTFITAEIFIEPYMCGNRLPTLGSCLPPPHVYDNHVPEKQGYKFVEFAG